MTEVGPYDPLRTEVPDLDAEFTVEYDEQTGPAWDVWSLTYPHREADARKYLVHDGVANEVYWYRDTRDGRWYGLPDITLVRAYNERLFARERLTEDRRERRRRVGRTFGLFLGLTFVLFPIIPDVAPWLWVSSPLVFLALRTLYGRAPKARYGKLAEVRFDEFRSDAEKRRTRDHLLAVAGGVVTFVLWRAWRRHHHG